MKFTQFYSIFKNSVSIHNLLKLSSWRKIGFKLYFLQNINYICKKCVESSFWHKLRVNTDFLKLFLLGGGAIIETSVFGPKEYFYGIQCFVDKAHEFS